MKLYVLDNSKKIYLNESAKTRNQLAVIIGSEWFSLKGKEYHVHQVLAKSDDDTIIGSLIGAILGALSGFWGIILGAIFGYLLSINQKDIDETIIFNNSEL